MKASLLNIPAFTLMELWAELTECYHSVNDYAGNTAEIYAYRLQMYSPKAHSDWGATDSGKARARELALESNEMLIQLCAMFAERYDCNVLINDYFFDEWPLGYEFDHRLHVTVEKKSLPTKSSSRPSNKAMQANY